jgi:hypothetical protein
MTVLPNLSCSICGDSPAAYLVVSSAAARFLWWNRQVFQQPVCAMCAERIYLEVQKRNGRQGWWGFISFFYAAFSAVRNKLSIEAHRKSIPLIVYEGHVYPRPKLHIRSDAGTVIASIGFVLLIAFIAFYSEQASKPIPRNSQGQVTAPALGAVSELKVGDCLPTAGEGNTVSSLDLTPCTNDHSWQVFGIGKLTGRNYSHKAVSDNASAICNKAIERIDRTITDQLNVKLNTLTLQPTESSWQDGERLVSCLVGSESYKFANSFLKK